MLRAGQSLPPKGLSTLRFDAGRFPPTPAACYRASWQLPGPDSHRLADTSLRVDYLNATTSKGVITSRTHATGHTKVPLERRRSFPPPLPGRRCAAPREGIRATEGSDERSRDAPAPG